MFSFPSKIDHPYPLYDRFQCLVTCHNHFDVCGINSKYLALGVDQCLVQELIYALAVTATLMKSLTATSLHLTVKTIMLITTFLQEKNTS